MHANARFTVVAAAMAKLDLWNKVIPQWQDVLRTYKIDYFHATEVNRRTGQCDGWSPTYRDNFVKSLFDVISGKGIIFHGYILEAEIFHSTVSELQIHNVSIYDYLLCSTVSDISGICGSINTNGWKFDGHRLIKGEPHEVSIFVEDGCALTTTLYTICSRLASKGKFPFVERMNSGNKMVVPLQVADLLSYDIYKEFETNPRTFENINRFSLKRLEHENRLVGKVMTRDWVRKDLPSFIRFLQKWENELEN